MTEWSPIGFWKKYEIKEPPLSFLASYYKDEKRIFYTGLLIALKHHGHRRK